MAAFKLAVAGDAVVEHPSVDSRDELDPPGPVLGHEVPGQPGLVHPVHAHEAPTA